MEGAISYMQMVYLILKLLNFNSLWKSHASLNWKNILLDIEYLSLALNDM